MNNLPSIAEDQLEAAFVAFNQLSEKLSVSYGDLEAKVATLSDELTESRKLRLVQIAETEALADRLQVILDTLPAAILVVDSADRIIQVNPLAQSMLGDSLIGKHWQRVAQSTLMHAESEIKLTDGRWVSYSVTPLNDNDGFIVLISDVTELRCLQKRLNQQQRLSSLGEMVASIAHQIRTPLASAILYISTMNHPAHGEVERLDFADKAKQRLVHLERMVTDMLMFAKGDVVSSENIAVREFLLQLKEQLSQDDRIDVFNFIIDGSLGTSSVRANKDILNSALQNLIDNAIDASAGDVRIIIRATINDGMFQLQIKDYGCGIDDSVKERVLEPFFTTRNDGTGLGLSVVDQAISHIGGALSIDSKPGVGTTIGIEIPESIADDLMPSNLMPVSLPVETKSGDHSNVTKLPLMEKPNLAIYVTGQEVS